MDQTGQKTVVALVFALALSLLPASSRAVEPGCAPDTQEAKERALRDIDAWSGRMKREDPRYIKIEDVLMRRVDFVISAMPSQYWLPALQLMYATAAEASAPPEPPALHRF